MSHSLTRIWIHAVWGTKERCPFMNDEKLSKIINHLKDIFDEQNCGIRIINGTEDHIHSFFLLDNNKSIKEIMMNVKGETSHWINKEGFYKAKFGWQVGYGAFSVSESLVRKVENYIKNQKEHHRKMTFKEEWDMLMKKHNVMIMGNL